MSVDDAQAPAPQGSLAAQVRSWLAAAYYALAAAAEDNDELPAAASLAQAYCRRARRGDAVVHPELVRDASVASS